MALATASACKRLLSVAHARTCLWNVELGVKVLRVLGPTFSSLRLDVAHVSMELTHLPRVCKAARMQSLDIRCGRASHKMHAQIPMALTTFLGSTVVHVVHIAACLIRDIVSTKECNLRKATAWCACLTALSYVSNIT